MIRLQKIIKRLPSWAGVFSLRLCMFYVSGFALGLSACGDNRAANYQSAEAPETLRWSLPESDMVSILSQQPNECLPDEPDAQQIMGRLAFRSPFLLGGQAARRGLTCQACHAQGQVNSHFFVKGLSETPGTADVTSFHFSDVLGDESFNPVPIPSLSDDIEGVDFDPALPDLRKFVNRLITKEFTGPQPSKAVQSALLAYLRALTAQPCAAGELKQAALLRYKLDIVTQSFQVLGASELEADTVKFMTAALRIELGRLHARFLNDAALQTQLAQISQRLKPATREALQAEQRQWAALKGALEAAYARSLFSPDIIREWAAARR